MAGRLLTLALSLASPLVLSIRPVAGSAVDSSQLAKRNPAGWTLVGCAQDQGSPRLLSYEVPDNSANSAEVCTAACAAKGYSIAGMEYGVECFCDNSYGFALTLLTNGACNTNCPGNSAELCGGTFALNVWKSNSAVTTTTTMATTTTSHATTTTATTTTTSATSTPSACAPGTPNYTTNGKTFTPVCGAYYIAGSNQISQATQSSFTSCIQSCATTNGCTIADYSLNDSQCYLLTDGSAGGPDAYVFYNYAKLD